jgi:hypothetical protein
MHNRILFAVRPDFTRAEIGFWRRLRDTLQTHDLTLVLASSALCPSDLGIDHTPVATSPDDFWPAAEGAGVPVSLLGLDEDALLARESHLAGPPIVPAVERSRRTALSLIAGESLESLHAFAPVLTVIQQAHHVAESTLAAASRLGGTPVLYTEGEPTIEGLFDADGQAQRMIDTVAPAPWSAPDAVMQELLRLRSVRVASWPATGTKWLDRRDVFAARLSEWHYGHSLRNALLPAYDAARQHRHVRVWGSGAARRAVSCLLQAAGTSVDDRAVGAEGIRTTPVPDFIIVATAAHDGTTHHLESLGFRRGADYSVLEPQILHALHLRDAA